MKRIFFLLALLAILRTTYAQIDTDNMQKALAAIEQEQYADAWALLSDEMDQNPTNAYAYMYATVLRMETQEYGYALNLINTGLDKVKKSNKDERSMLHHVRSDVYLQLKDTTAAYKDLKEAISLTPNDEDLYEQRAQIYFEQRNFTAADKDYKQILKMDATNKTALLGLARNACRTDKYALAIEYCTQTIMYWPNEELAYAWRAEAYFANGNLSKAMDDVIKSLDIEPNEKAEYYHTVLAVADYPQMIAKLQVQLRKAPKQALWFYYLGTTHELNSEYRPAIEAYNAAQQRDMQDMVWRRIAACYKAMGNYPYALAYSQQAMAMDSTFYRNIEMHADCAHKAGHTEWAKADYMTLIEQYPDYANSYINYAWIALEERDFATALTHLNIALSIQADPYTYLLRGIVYYLSDAFTEALADWQQVVLWGDEEAQCFAYAYMGEKDRAMNLLAEKDIDTYDKACIYAILKDPSMALQYLEEALANDSYDFRHIRLDWDLDNIRQTDAFIALLNQYESKHQESLQIHKEEDARWAEQNGVTAEQNASDDVYFTIAAKAAVKNGDKVDIMEVTGTGLLTSNPPRLVMLMDGVEFVYMLDSLIEETETDVYFSGTDQEGREVLVSFRTNPEIGNVELYIQQDKEEIVYLLTEVE